MKKKLTKRKIKAFIRDERMANAEYRRYGLPCLARDEKKHWRFLKHKLKGIRKKCR